MSVRTLGNGATLGYSLTGSGTYTLVGDCKSLGTPEVEYTNPECPALTDIWMVREAGLPDAKQIMFSIYQTTANQLLLGTTLGGLLVTWQLSLADTHTMTCQGMLKSYKSKVDRNEALLWDVVIDLTGPVTFA